MTESLQKKAENGMLNGDDIQQIIALLDSGTIRVAEKQKGTWQTQEWIKKAILAFFGTREITEERMGSLTFCDKIPLKTKFEKVRIAPGGSSVRYGSFLANGVVMMPPAYVNIGAYVDEGTMIDSNVLVGSCAQIGKRVHLSAGVQIGGVLEPAQATPTIIEDDAFIGAGCIVVEGVCVSEGAVLAPGVVLSASTKILEIDGNGKIIQEHYGVVPQNAIVIPGARPRGEVLFQTPILVGYRTEETGKKVEINDLLRQF